MKRMGKLITNKTDVDYILSIDEKIGTKKSTIMELFGEFNGKRRFNTYDMIDVPPGAYGPEGRKNKNKFRTTIGIWIFNRVFIERELFDMYHYVNKTITKKVFNKIAKEITFKVLENKYPLSALKNYMLKCQKFMPYVTVLSETTTMKLLTITQKVETEKAKLLKKYEKEVKAKDPYVILKIQNELLKMAEDELKDDSSMDIYRSGAKEKLNNDFKNMYIMKGLTKNPDPTKGYNLITSSYMTGIKKEEYADFANSLAEGPYARGIKTGLGGYWEKLALPAYQHIKMLPNGSDCHTKRHIKIKLTNDNYNKYIYSFAKVGSKYVELTSENKSDFIGKEVQLRFSSLCEAKDGICNMCGGNAFYRLGITNIGAAIPQLPAKLKLISMKAFHDSQVVMETMDPMKAFGFDN